MVYQLQIENGHSINNPELHYMEIKLLLEFIV